MDGCMYGWRYRFPLYSTGLRPLPCPLGPLPKNVYQTTNLSPREDVVKIFDVDVIRKILDEERMSVVAITESAATATAAALVTATTTSSSARKVHEMRTEE